ncbi:hypothetical protein niasHS_008062 [Heterodera schachtii]|uniref:DNA-directed DNA polymerase n=1 Tax=Heterodera schachtii TaxID=97005 RepID=A0ABD2J9Y2_HETSC
MKNSSSSPPSKRSRRFFIEELLREPYNELSPPKKAPKDYIKKLDSEIEHVPKFKLVKNKSRFIIKDIPADPEALLMGVFQHCMDEAIIDSRQSGVEPTHLGCIVSSQNLSSDIWIPIRQLTPDTINTILNRFNDVAQSKKQDGVTLWGEPFTVTIQNFDDDNYCLFYAIQATLVRSIGDLDRRRFHDYVNGNSEMRGKLKNDALEMMNAVNAPAGQPNYDAEVYVPRIVDWWNGEKFVDQWKFKTFVFGSAGHYKPLFKYGPEDYVVPIILYFEEGHFNGVQKSGNLFGKPYCLSCEKTYDRPKRHIVNCKARCIKCPKNEARGWRLVIFDLETMQHEPVDPQIPERRKHQVNFVTAKVACPDCISNGQWKESLLGKKCNICGYHRTITFSQMPFNGTTVDRQVIDRHPLVSFVKWILYNLPKQYDTIAYSHFGGRFDMVLVFRELFMEGLNPSMIKNGNRLLEMKVKSRKKLNPNISFRDSWNLVPGPLASLVPMFGLDVQDKPFFPHLANRPENYGCQIFPTKSNYLAGGMNPEKRKEFDIWYAQNRNQPFLLDEALASYCKNDVDILMAGLIAFRTEFLEMSKRPADPDGKANRAAYTTPHNGIDPLKHCITIASACMRHFRTNHLKPGHLALVPEKGYDSCGDNQMSNQTTVSQVHQVVATPHVKKSENQTVSSINEAKQREIGPPPKQRNEKSAIEIVTPPQQPIPTSPTRAIVTEKKATTPPRAISLDTIGPPPKQRNEKSLNVKQGQTHLVTELTPESSKRTTITTTTTTTITEPPKETINDLVGRIEEPTERNRAEELLSVLFGDEQWKKLNLHMVKQIIEGVELQYHPNLERFKSVFTHPRIEFISFSPQLGYVLGFENAQHVRNNEIAKYGSDLRGGFASFAVYAKGLTENMIVGNSLSSLLRVVSVVVVESGMTQCTKYLEEHNHFSAVGVLHRLVQGSETFFEDSGAFFCL